MLFNLESCGIANDVKSRTTEYPILVELTDEEKSKCQNQELKTEGEFCIKQIHNGCSFVAYIVPEGEPQETPDYMCQLNAQSGGICDDVTTEPGYRQCGLAKYLMKACFEDDGILGPEKKGYDVRKEYPGIPNYWIMERRARRVYEYCRTVTFTSCQVDSEDTSKYACIAYIRAALLASFHILFAFKSMSAKGIKLVDVEKIFTYENADKFVEDNGEYWFFCKCSEQQFELCMTLVDYNTY